MKKISLWNRIVKASGRKNEEDESCEIICIFAHWYLTPAAMINEVAEAISVAEKAIVTIDTAAIRLMNVFSLHDNKKLATIYGVEVGDYMYYVQVGSIEFVRCRKAAFRFVETSIFNIPVKQLEGENRSTVLRFLYDAEKAHLTPVCYAEAVNGNIVNIISWFDENTDARSAIQQVRQSL